MTPPTYLTVEETAVIIGTSPEYVMRELRKKRLRGAKIGRTWNIAPADVERYVDAHMNVSKVRGAAS